jgi:hypothetical protein
VGGGKRVLLFESWWLNSELEPCLKQRGCRGKREAGTFGTVLSGVVTWSLDHCPVSQACKEIDGTDVIICLIPLRCTA